MSYFREQKSAVLERGPAPFVTWLSPVGRIELSTVTFANAVSKAGNFLVDGLELELSSKLKVVLGNHWQSPVWLATSLCVGIELNDQAPILIAHSDAITSWTGAIDELIVVSRDPFGMPEKDLPAGYINGSAEVRNFGDYFSPSWENLGTVLTFEDVSYSWSELVAMTDSQRVRDGIESGTRVGVVGNLNLLQATIYQVVMPISFGISIVLIDQVDPDISKITSQEKIATFLSMI
jgi:uncharacterized protein (TIGR03089 family)